MVLSNELKVLDGQSCAGTFFLRNLIESLTDEGNLSEILQEVARTLAISKTPFTPTFTFICFRSGRKDQVRIVIMNGQHYFNHINLDYVKGVLKIHSEPVVKNHNKDLTYKGLHKRLKPSVVNLNDEEVSKVSEYLEEFKGLYRSFLQTLRFDLHFGDKSLVIQAKDGSALFDERKFAIA